MTREKLQNIMDDFSDNSPLNYADEDSGLAGLRFFQHPFFSLTRADSPRFKDLRRPDVVGEHHLMPEDWLSGAKTVISIFLPYDRAVVDANKKDPLEPAVEWVYTRIDGQRFLLALGDLISDTLKSDGYNAITPCTEERFIMRAGDDPAPGTEHIPKFSSNWSERHVGFAAGLGTFGISTNFISKYAGTAGRLLSIITDWETTPDPIEYDDFLEYCNSCGVCIRRCPANAFYADKHGKDHSICGQYIRKVSAKHTPRYGCGKCQSGLPCDYNTNPR